MKLFCDDFLKLQNVVGLTKSVRDIVSQRVKRGIAGGGHVKRQSLKARKMGRKINILNEKR